VGTARVGARSTRNGGHRAGVRRPLAGVGPFHLGEQRQQHRRQLPHRVGRVGRVDLDRIGQVTHPHLTLGQLMDQVQRVPHGAAQPVQGVYHDLIASPGEPQHRPQPRPVHRRPGLVVQIDPLPGRPRPRSTRRSAAPGSCLTVDTRAYPNSTPRTVRELGGARPTRHAVVRRLLGHPSQRGILPGHRQERAVSLPSSETRRGVADIPRSPGTFPGGSYGTPSRKHPLRPAAFPQEVRPVERL
jgi:hypothetical protein